MKTVFIYKDNTSSDDCSSMRYIKIPENNKELFEYENSFMSIDICGIDAWIDFRNIKKEDITTILSQNDIDSICKYNKEIKAAKYRDGTMIVKTYLKPIFKKLMSKENKELYLALIKQEKEFLVKKYNLSMKDINYIIKQYPFGDYIDRAMIIKVYDDKEKFAEDEGWDCGYITNKNYTYINLEKLGDYLLKGVRYYELIYFHKNNKIIVFDY